MSAQWQPREIKEFRGLLDRRQRYLDTPEFQTQLWNMHLHGGGAAKRGGSVLLTGVARKVLSATATLITLTEDWPFTKVSGMTVTVYHRDGTVEVATADAGGVASEIILQAPITPPMAGDVVYFQVPLGDDGGVLGSFDGTYGVRGLFASLYRSRNAYLVAVANGRIYEPSRPDLSAFSFRPLAEFPAGVSAPIWNGNSETPFTSAFGSNAAGTTLNIVSAEGTYIGSPIRFLTTTGLYEGRVAGTVVFRYDDHDQITVEPAFTGTVAALTPISFWDFRDDLETYGVMFGNYQHLVFDQLGSSGTGHNAPVKIRDEGTERRVQRSGLAPAGMGAIASITDPNGGPSFVEITNNGVAVSGEGVSAVQYSYRYSWRNTTGGQTSEGQYIIGVQGFRRFADVIAFTPAAGDGIRLVIRGNIDPQVGQVDIWRSAGADPTAAGPWLLVDSIPNTPGGDMVYVDEVPDLGLGRRMRQFLDNPPPSDLRYVSVWPSAQRLIGITMNPPSVVFSDGPDLEDGTFKSESWPVGNQLFVGLDDGDEYVALAGFYDSVLVFKRHSVWRIAGVPPSSQGGTDGTIVIQPVHFRDDRTGLGALSGKALVQDKDEVQFPSQDGIYLLNRWGGGDQGFESKRLSTAIDRLAMDLSARNSGVTAIPHAAYLREWRQTRWFFPNMLIMDAVDATTGKSPIFVHQLETGPQSPGGWARWMLSRLFTEVAPDTVLTDELANTILTQSCIYPAESAMNEPPEIHGHRQSLTPEDLGPAAMIVADKHGNLLQMDYGQEDYGAFPFKSIWECMYFAPAGRGRQVRAKAWDLILNIRSVEAALQLEIETDILTEPIVVPIEFTGDGSVDWDRWDYLVRELVEQHHSELVSAPGQYHRLRITEQPGPAEDAEDPIPWVRTAWWMLIGATFWYQALSQRTVGRSAGQAELPPVAGL